MYDKDVRYQVEMNDYGYMIFDSKIDDYIDLGDGILLDAFEVLTFFNDQNLIMFDNVKEEEVN